MSSHMPKAPCQICGDLNAKSQDSLTFKTTAISQSADGGCVTCQLLRDGLVFARPKFVDEADTIKLEKRNEGPLALTYVVKGSPAEETIEMYSHADMPTAYSWIGPAKEISTDSSSDECFKLIQGWIQDCVTTHSQCPGDLLPQLPTRVIDVGTADHPPRLHIHNQERGQYIALSHCWGSPAKAAATIKTTAETLQEFKSEIPWNRLTKTFRDAISITRRLGIRYIWIDSLCIIQGDSQDWAIEASRMTTVYANAHAVIAASGAKDGDGGCFIGDRSASIDGVRRVECAGLGGTRSSVYMRRSRRGFHFTLAEMRGGEYSHGWRSAFGQPLEQRAWTFQEEELAPRILFYTEHELQWRCSTLVACECRGVRKSSKAQYLRRRLATYTETGPAPNGQVDPSTKSGPEETVAAWYFIVAEYTRRDITYISDRLPGLSGIAGCWERAESDTYHAGLWEKDFPRHLLWWSHAVGLEAPARGSLRHPTYYAPSWSWASITGAVQHVREPGDIRVRVIDVQTEPATLNPFGPAKRGNLILWGVLIPMKVEVILPVPPVTMVMFKAVDTRVDGRTADLGSVLPDVRTIGGDMEIDMDETHYLLPIGAKVPNYTGSNAEFPITIASLVLRKSRSSPRAFERVGFVLGTIPRGRSHVGFNERTIHVGSNKSLVGVGANGIIRGKTLRLIGNSNVIIQNIHFTDLNPQFIWGADAITFHGTDLVWIDHCTISKVGRQQLVSGFGGSGRATISYNEFDGRSDFSCDGMHYYMGLMIGDNDSYTWAHNYHHHGSGRNPVIGTAVEQGIRVHAFNNLHEDCIEGLAVTSLAWALVEGNFFEGTTTPVAPDAAGKTVWVANPSNAADCAAILGRNCWENVVSNSGDLVEVADPNTLQYLQDLGALVQPDVAPADVADNVRANAGFGKI